jgi:hypothetical protein
VVALLYSQADEGIGYPVGSFIQFAVANSARTKDNSSLLWHLAGSFFQHLFEIREIH